MRCHCPPASFIGYFRRRSLCTISRMAAPLAQCVPRLIGLSQEGSCPVHTPFCTSAVTVQPTEQCVHTFLRSTVGSSGRGPGIVEAWVTDERGIAPRPAKAAVPNPDLRKNVRRSNP